MNKPTHPRKQKKKSANDEPKIAWTHTPRIAPGIYPGYSRSASTYRDAQFKRWVCAVQVDILSADLSIKLGRVTWFLNLGDGENPRAGRRSKYWGEWVRANGAQPVRKDRLAPKVFTLRYGHFVVADTTKTFNHPSVSKDATYSVIRSVATWDSGRGGR